VIVTWYLQKSTTLSVEAIIGVLFVLALAIGILITPEVDLLEALFGDVSKITLTDTIITVLVSVCAIFVTRTIYEKLAVSMISKELAIASRMTCVISNYDLFVHYLNSLLKFESYGVV
jgi:ABC-type Mn2+/Zn2+ transport system permease subunit